MGLPLSPKNLLLAYAVRQGTIKNGRLISVLRLTFLICFWSTLSREIGLQLEINRLSLFDF